MKVVIAIDSLKGSLTSLEAGESIREGILNVCKADVIVKPLADGGEGTLDALVTGMNGIIESLEVTGPIGKKVKCTYGILPQTNTAIIEMAEISGLTLVPDDLRNPLNTTTYGMGEVIKAAINKGCRNFLIGIGGSATNDGGVGMLQALGFEFYDKNMELLGLGGKILSEICYIKTEKRLLELDECSFKVACDVNNPLYGENGATYVYGPQKGVTPEMLKEFDLAMMNYAKIASRQLGINVDKVQGTGAAGGIGYAFLGLLNAELKSGIEIILEEIKLEQELMDADYVITGEGKLDFQTSMGKAPIGVARLSKKYNKKVIAFAGCITDGAVKCNEEGIDAYFSIVNSPMSLKNAMDKRTARKNMTETASQVFRLINSIQKV